MPLSDVASRISDNTCSPLTFVSGDEDGDGLLDTPNSIFEDAFAEIWTFTCTTTLTTTTTNTVVVTGTPTDPGGTPLCTTGPAGQALQVVGPCDARSEASATVTVTVTSAVAPATMTIIKRTTVPTTATFNFTFSGQTFSLASDGTRTFEGVAPGTYVFNEVASSTWTLAAIECTDASGDSVVTVAERQASIAVAPGETVTCTFTNRPSGALPATGASGVGDSIATSLVLLGLGGVFALAGRRRRVAG